MKKVFISCPLTEYRKHESKLKRAQVLGFRAKEPEKKREVFYLQNLEFYPKDCGKIEFDKTTGEVIIRIRLREGEFLAIGDAQGSMEKTMIFDKRETVH